MGKLISVLIVVAFMIFNIGVYGSHQSDSVGDQFDPQTLVHQETLRSENVERASLFFQNRR